jgi:hypothetical protein
MDGRVPGFSSEELFQCGDIRRHTFVIHGYNRINDKRASEKEFSTLAETVADTLNADSTVHSHSETPTAQMGTFEPRVFGDVLCHYAEITQIVIEEV